MQVELLRNKASHVRKWVERQVEKGRRVSEAEVREYVFGRWPEMMNGGRQLAAAN